MPPPGLGHLSLPGPPLPAWPLHGWAPPPPLWCSSPEPFRHPPHSCAHVEQPLLQRRLESDAPARILTQETWLGDRAHWNPPRAACLQPTAGCCPPTECEGQRRQSAGAEWGGAACKGRSAGAEWGGAACKGRGLRRMMEEAGREAEEVRAALRWGAGGASRSAETMASGDG